MAHKLAVYKPLLAGLLLIGILMGAAFMAESKMDKTSSTVPSPVENAEAQLPETKAPSSQDLESTQPSPQPVSIVMTGDVMLGRYIGTLIDRRGGAFPFTHVGELLEHIKSTLQVEALDIVAANLEGPITEKQIAFGDMVFRFKPSVADQLKNAGFTTLQLANNHSFNQGKTGFAETQEHLQKAGLEYFGEPNTAFGPSSILIKEINGIKVAFLGLNDVDFKLDIPKTVEKITELDKQVDVLIVGVHWGYEYEDTARQDIEEKAHAFVDAGADFIWGTHPHVIQNKELYNGHWIYYSLGNFIFDQYWSAATQKGLVLGLKIQPKEPTPAPSNAVSEPPRSFTLTPFEFPVNLVNQGEPKLSD